MDTAGAPRKQGLRLFGLALAWSTALWAAAAGFPRVGELLAAPGTPDFRLHSWLAFCCWPVAAALLGRATWRVVRPIPPPPRGTPESEGRVIWKQFQKNRMGVLGMYLVLFLFLLTLFTPMIAPYDPDVFIDAADQLSPPSWAYLMGTDEYRRDLFSRVLYGGRVSLSIGFIVAGLAGTIGTSLGAVAGYFGGWVDKGIMWFADLLLSLPRLVLLMAIVGFFRAAGANSIFLIVTILGLTGWMGVSRIVRSQVLSLKEQDFIQATRALGLPSSRIIFRHLVPNALAPVIVWMSLVVGSTILVEASLSFLGLGVPPPTATWGSLVNLGREYLRSGWWYTLFPGLMIAFAVMSFNLLGDGLRDALDPKLRGRG